MSDLSHLPSVDALLRSEAARSMIEQFGRELTVAAIRDTLETARENLFKGPSRRSILFA